MHKRVKISAFLMCATQFLSIVLCQRFTVKVKALILTGVKSSIKHFVIVLPSCGTIYIIMSDIHTVLRASNLSFYPWLVFSLEWGKDQSCSALPCHLLIVWLFCLQVLFRWDCIWLTLLMAFPYPLVMLPYVGLGE